MRESVRAGADQSGSFDIGWTGVVVAIYLAPSAGAPMVAAEEARAVPGQGLEGDRYFRQAGRWSRQAGTGRALTLIEDEAIEALLDEAGIELPPGATRRNVVTRGVPLNHLVNRDFRIGGVTLRGMRLCEPCNYLERLTEQTGVRRTLVHRGGLRAEILTEGVIRIGDAIREE